MSTPDKSKGPKLTPRVMWLVFDSFDDDEPIGFPTEERAKVWAENERNFFGRPDAYAEGPYILAEPSFVGGGT